MMLLKITLQLAAILGGGLVQAHGQGIISTTRLRQHLETLFNAPRSAVQPQEKDRVRKGTELELLTVVKSLPPITAERVILFSKQNFTVEGPPGQNLVLSIKGERHNTSEDKPILIGTHYDTVSDSPGTDDNGSGMAAGIEIARALLQATTNCVFLNTIFLVAFDFEEAGLFGSEKYVEHLVNTYLKPNGVNNFQGAYIMDTVMNFDQTPNSQSVPLGFEVLFPEEHKLLKENSFRGDLMAAIGRQDDSSMMDLVNKEWYAIVGGDFASTEKYRIMKLALPLTGSAQQFTQVQNDNFRDFFRSDHYSFWSTTTSDATGLKAVFLTDTADFRGSMQECYHEACDNVTTITDDKLEFLSVTAEAILKATTILSTENSNAQCLGNMISRSKGIALVPTGLIFTSIFVILI